MHETSIVPIPTGSDGNTRLDQIYRQLRELQQFKDEIMDDLDEFMDDEETKSLMTVHEDRFEEVVDIIAQEQRERGEQIVEYQEKGMTMAEVEETMSEAGGNTSEVLDENGKPFWMKFFKADYLADDEPKNTKKAAATLNNKKDMT